MLLAGKISRLNGVTCRKPTAGVSDDRPPSPDLIATQQMIALDPGACICQVVQGIPT